MILDSPSFVEKPAEVVGAVCRQNYGAYQLEITWKFIEVCVVVFFAIFVIPKINRHAREGILANKLSTVIENRHSFERKQLIKS